MPIEGDPTPIAWLSAERARAAHAGVEELPECLGFAWTPFSRLSTALRLDIGLMPNEGFALLMFVAGEEEVTGWIVLQPHGSRSDGTINFGLVEGECGSPTPWRDDGETAPCYPCDS